MSKASAAAVEQLALGDRGLMLELCSPIAEPLQRQLVKLAILPLVESALLPLLMMESPETLQLRPLLITQSRHAILRVDHAEEVQMAVREGKCAAAGRLPFAFAASLFRRVNTLFW